MAERYREALTDWIPAATDARPTHLAVTLHAVERCQERAAPMHSHFHVRQLLEDMAAQGHVRKTPRRWMRSQVTLTPGLRFLYWSDLPDICALVIGTSIVTVITRAMCRRPRPIRLVHLTRRRRMNRGARGQHGSKNSLEIAA